MILGNQDRDSRSPSREGRSLSPIILPLQVKVVDHDQSAVQ
jgi:hypothetical protein